MKNKVLKLQILFVGILSLFLFSTHFVKATTYYVDSAGGNDVNSGTSSGSPWQTLNKINNSTFAPGDSVLLKAGDVWRGQLMPPSSGTTSSPITFSSYGSGANPLINGSALVTNFVQPATFVSQANMKLSLATGTAFVDFNSSSSLIPYLGDQLTITDSAGHQISGYIKAAGTGETYGAENLSNTAFDTTSSIWNSGPTAVASVAGGQSGNALQLTEPTNYAGNAGENVNLTVGGLYFASIYAKLGTANSLGFQFTGGASPYPSYNATYPSPSNWTEYTLYGTPTQSTDLISVGGNVGTSLFDTASLTQVLTPSVTGVTIVSSSGGSTYNWTSQDPNFNPNDANGYTFAITGLPFGNPNIWQASLTTANAPVAKVWFNGALGTNVATTSALTAPNQWYWGNNTLYIYSTSNPNLAYTSPGIEAAVYNSIQIYDKGYIVVNGIDATQGARGVVIDSDLSTPLTNVTVKNGTYSYSGGEGIAFYAGNYGITGGVIQGNTLHDNGGSGVFLTQTYNYLVQNNIAYANGGTQWYAAGLREFEGPGGLFLGGNIFQYNISYANVRTGTYGGDGIHLDQVGNNDIIRYNNVYNNVQVGIQIESDHSASDAVGPAIYGNVSYNNSIGAFIQCRVGSDTTGATQNASHLYNNTFYGNSIGIEISGDGIATCNNNQIKNNISVHNSLEELSAYNGGDNNSVNGSGNVYQYNNFGSAFPGFIQWGGGSATQSTYAAWEVSYCGSSGCSHSVQSDPLITNASSSNFTVLPSSPTIDAGTNLGSSYNMDLVPTSTWPNNIVLADQNSYGSGWDMGAYTYVINSTSTATSSPGPVVNIPAGGSSSGGSGGGGGGYVSPVATTTPTPVTTSSTTADLMTLLSSLQAQLQSLLQQAAARGISVSGNSSSTFTFSRDLNLGSSGADVAALQHYLNTHGFPVVATSTYAGSLGYESPFFGIKTQIALAKFQKSIGIATATGYLGPITRRYMNSH